MYFFSSLFSFGKKFTRKLDTLNEITIKKEAILHNYFFLKNKFWGEIFPVLKSNAYGHGISQMVSILKNIHPKYYVVDSYYEALQIFSEDKKSKTLLIWYTPVENFFKINFSRCTLTIWDKDSLIALTELKKKINIHIKLDTGMNRQGIKGEKDLKNFLEILKKYPKISLEGVCTHMADADSEDEKYTKDQQKNFKKNLKIIHEYGFQPKYIHAGNSATTLRYKDDVYTAARIGISLYGIDPLIDVKKDWKRDLRCALDFTTTLVGKKDIKKWEKISYNGIYTGKKDMKIGILPVGYYEWIPRILSNNYSFYFQENKLPILGRVCMNLVIVDITDVSIFVGDKVSIISSEKNKKNTIYSLAKASETIPYESCTRLSSSIRRKVV